MSKLSAKEISQQYGISERHARRIRAGGEAYEHDSRKYERTPFVFDVDNSYTARFFHQARTATAALRQEITEEGHVRRRPGVMAALRGLHEALWVLGAAIGLRGYDPEDPDPEDFSI